MIIEVYMRYCGILYHISSCLCVALSCTRLSVYYCAEGQWIKYICSLYMLDINIYGVVFQNQMLPADYQNLTQVQYTP